MKRIASFIAICLGLSCNVQTNEAQKAYEEFKQQVNQDFSNFRKQANEQYAKFLEEAWEQFHTLPAIPKPKDETTPPIVAPEEDKDKPIDIITKLVTIGGNNFLSGFIKKPKTNSIIPPTNVAPIIEP